MARVADTETPERELGKYWPAPTDDGQITVPDVPGVPPAVREAADRSAEIYARKEEARIEREATRQALRAAAAIDQANDSAAASAGLPMPTDRVEPAAREAAAAASRRSDALEAAARHSTILLATIIRDEQPTWLPEATAAAEATRLECREALDRLDGLLTELAAEQQIATTLAGWPGGAWCTATSGRSRPASSRSTSCGRRSPILRPQRRSRSVCRAVRSGPTGTPPRRAAGPGGRSLPTATRGQATPKAAARSGLRRRRSARAPRRAVRRSDNRRRRCDRRRHR